MQMIEMVLMLYSFTIITGIGAWVLQHADSGLDILLATLFAPVSFHLAARILKTVGRVFVPARTEEPDHSSIVAENIPITPATEGAIPLVADTSDPERAKIDIDRRLFLKLIGSAGLSVFLMSIFTKRAHAAFFGSLPGTSAIKIKDTAGNEIDPAQEHPTDAYEIAEIDDASAPAYYGFVDATGAWYITREASDGSYRYAKGTSSFSTNWTGRAALSYGYYNDVF
jgi:hypothetical protein